MRIHILLDQVGRDVRDGLRQVRRNPAFSAVAVATLALGIGANTAMFSAVDAVLLRPLPYADAGRLVMVWDDVRQTDSKHFFTTPPEWSEWRRQNTVFTDIAASQPGDAALSGDGEPEEVPARKVSANFWSVLDVKPLVGRVFTENEDVTGARVVVISHGLWQRRFGGSPGVVGRTITLNDMAYEVVGVMPREFYFMPARDIDVWTPTSFTPAKLRNFGWHDVHTVARLKPGVTLRQAQDAMAALNLRVSAAVNIKPARSALVTRLREELAGKTAASLIALLCASAAVLLIACVNLANLQMARGAARRREVAVRAALGAGRARLIAQFLVESSILAGLGAVAGLALAIPVTRFLETLVPQTMAAVHLTLDGRALLFSAATAAAAGILFGLTPALRASRVAVQEELRDAGRGSASARSYRFQHSLIVVETALAVLLLTTGGLLLQTFRQLQGLDLGIRRENVLTFVTPLFRYRDFDRRVAFVNAELEKIRAIPGVTHAAAISRIPLAVTDQATFYRLAGQSNDDARVQVALSRVVTRDYFATVGARLQEGRFFDASDRRSQTPAALVNESFANRNFPGGKPLGARFKFGSLGEKGYWYTIVGVVKEIRDRG
jgi:putative ABC transport system permease protein